MAVLAIGLACGGGLLGGVSPQAHGAVRKQETVPGATAPPAFSLETVAPLAVPARPVLKTPALLPVPAPVRMMEPLALPDLPQVRTLPVPPESPPATAGIPTPLPVPPEPTPESLPEPPAAPIAAQPPAPPDAGPAVATAPEPAPPAAPPPPVPSQTAALPPVPIGAFQVALTAGTPEVERPETLAVADQVAAMMAANPDLRVALLSYASLPSAADDEIEARQLSRARAIALRKLLVARGIAATRIDLRPLGVGPGTDTGPADRIEIVPLR